MKRFFALVLAGIMLFSLAACGNKQEQPKGAITAYDTLEELNEATGAKLNHPAVMGVTDETFCTIEEDGITIAEYCFNINGKDYSMRFCADSTQDISGVTIGDMPAFAGTDGDANVMTEDGAFSRWFTIEGQYVLHVDGKDIDAEWFDDVTEEMRELTASWKTEKGLADYYKSLEGDWQDSASQRATATMTAEDDCVNITISWADSATVTNTWKMTARLYEDGLLTYSDCEYVIEDSNDLENQGGSVVYSDGEGFFSPQDDGTLLWDGAQDEMCTGCAFEKVV